jgi:hypothetical protein
VLNCLIVFLHRSQEGTKVQLGLEVAGISGDHLPEAHERALLVASTLVDHRQVDEGSGMVGIDAQGLLEKGLGLIEKVLPEKHRSQSGEGLPVLRIQANRSAVILDGLLRQSLLRRGLRLIVVFLRTPVSVLRFDHLIETLRLFGETIRCE